MQTAAPLGRLHRHLVSFPDPPPPFRHFYLDKNGGTAEVDLGTRLTGILTCCGIIIAHREVILRSPRRVRSIAYLLLKRVVGKRQQNSLTSTMLYDGWAIFTC